MRARMALATGLLMALATAASGVQAAPRPAPPPLPKIDILYPPGGSLLDRLCGGDFRQPLDPAEIQAAVAARPALQARWDAEGPAYLAAALTALGRPFPYREAQATLSVCLPASTSVPLVVDVRGFLPGAKRPAPEWEFVEIVFHELMHTYVSPVTPSSVLMRKYAAEPSTVRFHLHVMAVEKLVLLQLGRPEALATIDREYRTGPDPAYKRAWEIVNDIEGYEPFIAELKALAPPA